MIANVRLGAIALPLALTLACTTVRAPASAIAPTVWARDGVADPQVELYVESSSAVDPATLARASDEARRALREALADRHAPDGDAILVVRAQAVSRTADRRADQHAAIAGIVVGAVVIAAVVVLVVASGKGGGGVPRGILPAGAPHVPRAPRVPIAPVVRPRAVVRVTAACPAPAQPPVVVAAGPDGPEWPAEPPPPDTWAVPQEAPPPADGAAPEPPGPGVVAVTLPAPPPLELAERGFFARDLLRLELLLVDPNDGTVRAAKTVTRKIDVRDGPAVRAAVAAALDDPAGWWRAGAPSAPPPRP